MRYCMILHGLQAWVMAVGWVGGVVVVITAIVLILR